MLGGPSPSVPREEACGHSHSLSQMWDNRDRGRVGHKSGHG